MTEPLYFDDLAPGQVFRSGQATLSLEQIVAFAREFDPQPQHTDPVLATDSVFGTLVASGWHTASITMRLQLEAMLHRVPGGAMGGQIDTLVWHKPVLPGDMLRVELEVLELRPSRSRPDRGIAKAAHHHLEPPGRTGARNDRDGLPARASRNLRAGDRSERPTPRRGPARRAPPATAAAAATARDHAPQRSIGID